MALLWVQIQGYQTSLRKIIQNVIKKVLKANIFSEKMTSGNSEAAFLAEAWRTLEKTLLRCWRGSHWLSEVLATLLAAFLAFSELPLGLKSIDLAIKGSKNFGSLPRSFMLHQFTHALTMKGQNIGSSTKKKYKQIFDSGKLDSNKWKYVFRVI